MIPIRDNIPSRRVPVVNYGIIAVNIIVFFLELKAGAGLGRMIEALAFYPAALARLLDGESGNYSVLTTMFTSMFMHAGLGHLLGNMLYLYIFGDNVEDAMGHVGYLLFYLACGIAAVLFHYYTDRFSAVPTLGASGAIAGVMGAYFIFYPKARVLTLVPIFIFIQFIEIRAVYFLFLWFLMQFLLGTATMSAGAQGVAWWAHVGGFLTGAGAGFALRLTRVVGRSA